MSTSMRLRVLTGASLVALGLAWVPGSAQASDPGPPAVRTAQAHPADAFVVGWQYVPSTITIKRGETFTFGNYDVVQGIPSHSIDEFIPGCTAPPYTRDPRTCPRTRFSSGLVDWMLVSEVRGTDKLKPGTYDFVCQVHPFMLGELVVE
ncbi:MAG: hypothetical protein ACT4P1_15155 [Sporichthyaceae bacterium]